MCKHIEKFLNKNMSNTRIERIENSSIVCKYIQLVDLLNEK